ncbi:DUF6710 family protein [Tetragenococcus halophilus]|uniref:DUF6710 family protein n=1 Tax=Tetragenococcus halophilus TaxID=51669 RepID=UPI00256E4576|nr:DUF6710 family protein [Tetragenococcus halophilus]GMG67017.1 hypothetical protein TEHIT2_22080 [Tetragenococcus halophilus]
MLKHFMNFLHRTDNAKNVPFNNNRELFSSVMKNAIYILNETPKKAEENHPIFSFIKQFTDLITIETAMTSYMYGKQTRTDIMVSSALEAEYSKESETLIERIYLKEVAKEDSSIYHNLGYYYSMKPNISFDLTTFPSILNPWNTDRISKNLINVATKQNPFDKDQYENNINNSYYYPIGISNCRQGNHSQYSAKLKGVGISTIEEIINIEKLYKYVSFDGNYFHYDFPNDDVKKLSISNKIELYLGILFEVGRLLKDHPYIFPEDIKKCMANKVPF